MTDVSKDDNGQEHCSQVKIQYVSRGIMDPCYWFRSKAFGKLVQRANEAWVSVYTSDETFVQERVKRPLRFTAPPEQVKSPSFWIELFAAALKKSCCDHPYVCFSLLPKSRSFIG